MFPNYGIVTDDHALTQCNAISEPYMITDSDTFGIIDSFTRRDIKDRVEIGGLQTNITPKHTIYTYMYIGVAFFQKEACASNRSFVADNTMAVVAFYGYVALLVHHHRIFNFNCRIVSENFNHRVSEPAKVAYFNRTAFAFYCYFTLPEQGILRYKIPPPFDFMVFNPIQLTTLHIIGYKDD